MKLPHIFFRDRAAYDPAAHLLHIQDLHAKYPLNTIDKCNAFTLEIFKEVYGKSPPWLVLGELEELILHLFDANSIYIIECTKSTDREILEMYQRNYDASRIPIARAALIQILQALPLPPSVYTEQKSNGPTVPLASFIPNLAQHVEHTIHICMNTMHGERRVFNSTALDLSQNVHLLSGTEPGSGRKLTLPSDYDGDPVDYLRGTPLQGLFDAQVALTISRDRWPTHALILAPSEWGKSELTGMYLREAMEDPEPRAIILCDPHGDLYNKALPRVPQDRLVEIDLTKNPPDLNILDQSVLSDRSALETFRFMMSSLAGGLSPKQETCIKPLFSLLKNIPDANLVTLHEIITEQVKKAGQSKFAPYIAKLDTIHRVFFENLWYTGNFSETRDALTWKVSSALDDPVFYKMFSAKRNSMDVSRWIEAKSVVLVKSSDALDKEGTRLFFLFLLGQYYAAARRRDAIPEEKRHLAMFFIDEASIVLQSKIISDILVEIRKYKCSFAAATQLWAHVAEDVRPAVLGSSGIRIVGQLGINEAKALAPDMGISAEEIKSLRNVPKSHAEWYFYIRSVTDKAVRARADYGILEAMPKVSTSPHSHIVAAELYNSSSPQGAATSPQPSNSPPPASAASTTQVVPSPASPDDKHRPRHDHNQHIKPVPE